MRRVLFLCACVCGWGLHAMGDNGAPSATNPAESAPTTKSAEAGPATTTAPADPEQLVRVQWNAVLAVLQNADLDAEAKAQDIERIVSPLIDFPAMARLALGRENWGKFTPAQRQRFLSLFVAWLKQSYRERIARYDGQGVVVKPALPSGKPGQPAAGPGEPPRTSPKGSAYIPVELTSKDRKIAILHKFREVSGEWKMYDTEIEGVSILLTYRSQFNDVLRTGTVEDLLERLARRDSLPETDGSP